MRYLQTAGRHVVELERLVSDERLNDVTIKPPFMGNVVIWCGSDRSHDRLTEVLAKRNVA